MASIAIRIYFSPQDFFPSIQTYRPELLELEDPMPSLEQGKSQRWNRSVEENSTQYFNQSELFSTFSPFTSNQRIARIAVFFHMFQSENKRKQFETIVSEQIGMITSAGILSKISAIYYVYFGYNYMNYSVPHDSGKFIKSNRSSSTGTEATTLKILHEHCIENPIDVVFYLHTKGSFHSTRENDYLRRNLMKAALHCLNSSDIFEHSDLCGFRFSPVPYPQMSGKVLKAQQSKITTVPGFIMLDSRWTVCNVNYLRPLFAQAGNIWSCPQLVQTVGSKELIERISTSGKDVFDSAPLRCVGREYLDRPLLLHPSPAASRRVPR
jgi:hypothetical protein